MTDPTSSLQVADSSRGGERLPEDLLAAYWRSVSSVELLRSIFPAARTIATWGDWSKLPTTSSDDYLNVQDVRLASREPHRLFAPAAPLHLNSPGFPLTILQSIEDKLLLDARLTCLLQMVGITSSEKITLAASPDQRYAVADLVELLVCLDHQCVVFLLEERRRARFWRRASQTEARVVFWMAHQQPSPAEIPSSIETLVTFNRLTESPPSRLSIDVLHFDFAPYFGFGTPLTGYTFLTEHFHLDFSTTGELLLTTLLQDLIPLIRFRTGVFGKVAGNKLFLRREG